MRWKMGRGNRYPKQQYRMARRLLDGGSLGTPNARAIMARVPQIAVDEVLRRYDARMAGHSDG